MTGRAPGSLVTQPERTQDTQPVNVYLNFMREGAGVAWLSALT